jgi:hypothetical protein
MALVIAWRNQLEDIELNAIAKIGEKLDKLTQRVSLTQCRVTIG